MICHPTSETLPVSIPEPGISTNVDFSPAVWAGAASGSADAQASAQKDGISLICRVSLGGASRPLGPGGNGVADNAGRPPSRYWQGYHIYPPPSMLYAVLAQRARRPTPGQRVPDAGPAGGPGRGCRKLSPTFAAFVAHFCLICRPLLSHLSPTFFGGLRRGRLRTRARGLGARAGRCRRGGAGRGKRGRGEALPEHNQKPPPGGAAALA